MSCFARRTIRHVRSSSSILDDRYLLPGILYYYTVDRRSRSDEKFIRRRADKYLRSYASFLYNKHNNSIILQFLGTKHTRRTMAPRPRAQISRIVETLQSYNTISLRRFVRSIWLTWTDKNVKHNRPRKNICSMRVRRVAVVWCKKKLFLTNFNG